MTLGSQLNCSMSRLPSVETVASVEGSEPSEVEECGTCRWSDPFLSSKSVFVKHKIQMEMTKPSPHHVAPIPSQFKKTSRGPLLQRLPRVHTTGSGSAGQCPHHGEARNPSVCPMGACRIPSWQLKISHLSQSSFFRKGVGKKS